MYEGNTFLCIKYTRPFPGAFNTMNKDYTININTNKWTWRLFFSDVFFSIRQMLLIEHTQCIIRYSIKTWSVLPNIAYLRVYKLTETCIYGGQYLPLSYTGKMLPRGLHNRIVYLYCTKQRYLALGSEMNKKIETSDETHGCYQLLTGYYIAFNAPYASPRSQ